MQPEFNSMELFGRINVQAEMAFQEFVTFIAHCAGGQSRMNAITSQAHDISIFENDDFDTEKSHLGDDRWLYFRYTLEIDPIEGISPGDYVAAIGALLKSLWSSGVDAVAACDFEEQLPRNVRRSKWTRVSRPDNESAGATEMTAPFPCPPVTELELKTGRAFDPSTPRP
jgi:hypothetical protein